MLDLDFKRTALVLIDLQCGIVRSFDGDAVVERATRLVKRFRDHNGFIAFVNVDFHDGRDVLAPSCDAPTAPGQRPPDWGCFVDALGVGEHDYTVTKRQWGAFFGTDLDLQLRRRRIDTIVLAGIATNIGVESTARQAFELGYAQYFVVDAMKTASPEAHEATVKFIFPRLGHVVDTAAVTG
ncbi:isochorismatase family protein [Jeongeupia chitinilytica]|uniref:Isochorismatase family protein YwoC n=1 Tax=Jeongeupia chitinilytica TaxID=1041641 RepID=A0ABQ3GZ44_9NEIS|nr:isochorismatase family protein [Jeongeupia chitinilytica]GHD61576.1 putative isochorismatase family protein YwoC [Jeongeupia chitinilytica]